jgi:hypothetical protein
MEINSAGVNISGWVPGLRAGDPVPITLQLPEGPVTVEGWCAEVRCEAYQEGYEYSTRISWYPSRVKCRPGVPFDGEIDDSF